MWLCGTTTVGWGSDIDHSLNSKQLGSRIRVVTTKLFRSRKLIMDEERGRGGGNRMEMLKKSNLYQMRVKWNRNFS